MKIQGVLGKIDVIFITVPFGQPAYNDTRVGTVIASLFDIPCYPSEAVSALGDQGEGHG